VLTGLLIAARGFCMGAADVVPGVSGGTMAFILGIYPRLVAAIRAFDWELVRLLAGGRVRAAVRHTDLVFLIWLGAGIAAALGFFTRVVPLPTLIRTQPVPVYSLFFGLILASVVVLLYESGRLGVRDLALVVAGSVAGYAVVNLVPVNTPTAAWFVFISGAVSICAMILPGISGSFILLVLNKYAYVLGAIARLDVAVLIPFALGAVSGLLLFSRLLSWLLAHWYRATLLGITGLLVGSLWVIWPFQERTFEVVRGEPRLVASSPALPGAFDGEVAQALGMMALGLALVLGLHALQGRIARSA